MVFRLHLLSLLVTGAAVNGLLSMRGPYVLKDSYVGRDFLECFDFEAIQDPTHGRVNYVDKDTALDQNLTYTTKDTFILRADYKSKLDPNGPGRNSVRIISQKQYKTSVTVVDLRHAPMTCASWPAIWTTSRTVPWPTAGEIDILEGVNGVGRNAATLHTTEGCTMSAANMTQTGRLTSENCYWRVNYNTGCSVSSNKPTSFGKAFNDVGGGWYAMERTSTHISVWFWARNEPIENIPRDIREGNLIVKPEEWGLPFAHFTDNTCDIKKKFGPNNLIINLTFCGDWAGNNYPATCPQTCVDYVNNNPEAFKDAYFDIGSVRVYEPPGIHRRHSFERGFL
ncbi:hypothetical protein FRC03_011401 [Tulasnella sp. 419]|nr:hypothetical protein FRC02_005049 [Tulasnella sp. 418]KAG8954776.1 hypothetical protein FRC03_011401 [Tulasnella sp. 419]